MPKILKTILKSFIEEKVEAPKHPSCPFQKSNWGVVVRFEQSLNFIHIVPPQILEYMYMYLFLYYFFLSMCNFITHWFLSWFGSSKIIMFLQVIFRLIQRLSVFPSFHIHTFDPFWLHQVKTSLNVREKKITTLYNYNSLSLSVN